MTGVGFVIETVPITSAGDKIEARELFKFLTDRVKRHTGFSFNRPDMKFSTPVVKKQLKGIRLNREIYLELRKVLREKIRKFIL